MLSGEGPRWSLEISMVLLAIWISPLKAGLCAGNKAILQAYIMGNYAQFLANDDHFLRFRPSGKIGVSMCSHWRHRTGAFVLR